MVIHKWKTSRMCALTTKASTQSGKLFVRLVFHNTYCATNALDKQNNSRTLGSSVTYFGSNIPLHLHLSYTPRFASAGIA